MTARGAFITQTGHRRRLPVNTTPRRPQGIGGCADPIMIRQANRQTKESGLLSRLIDLEAAKCRKRSFDRDRRIELAVAPQRVGQGAGELITDRGGLEGLADLLRVLEPVLLQQEQREQEEQWMYSAEMP